MDQPFAAIISALILAATLSAPALADENFSDGSRGEKIHTASGFVCPAKIGLFERDAVGARDPQAGAVYCAYSKLDGVYGTILIKPLSGPYDSRTSLAGAFEEAQSTGGRMIAEANLKLGARQSPLDVYARTYETARLTDTHYRALYTGAAIGNWAVELIIEYADPRDMDAEKEFLNGVYSAAASQIAAPSPLMPAPTRH